MKIKHKKAVIAAAAAIVLFILYNVIWYCAIWQKYSSYTTGMTELYADRSYVIDDLDGFTYNVKMPGYLQFNGNLGIQPYQHGHCAMIIWPGVVGDDEYGVFLENADGNMQAVTLTADLKAPADAPEETKALVEQYRDEIDNLYALASEQWDL